MEFQFSDKVNSFKPGIFAALNEKKEERVQKELPVYNLSIGTPDFKPAPYVMKAMEEACKDPENYKYSSGRTSGADRSDAEPLSDQIRSEAGGG